MYPSLQIKATFFGIMFLALLPGAFSQSIELMPGNQRLFADVQFLKPIHKEDFTWTVFSRTRGTLDYENNTDLFSAAYFNYTSKIGLGGSIVGSLATGRGGGVGIGVNFFKATEKFSVFVLVSVDLDKPPTYSWFSIAKYYPVLKNKWKLYSSLELFTQIGNDGHLFSVQRMRLGLSYQKLQFGFGANIWQAGEEYVMDSNLGPFIRKEF